MPGPLHSTASRQNLHESKRQKEPVRAASTANVSLSTPGAALDGVTLASGDRILLKDQTTASQNGIYLWTGASAALTRATDASASTDMLAGDEVYVREGTTNGATFWYLSTSAAITLGTTALTYTKIGAGSGTVTSVAMTVPTGFSVSGSPVTTSGTLAVTESTQSANTVKAGPASGAAATPAYRALVAADVPVMGASGGSHAAGAAPDPGSSAGTTKFLREDATWQVPAGGGSTTPLAVNARLRLSGNQSIPTATATAITWDTEDADTDNQHFTSAANLTGTVAKTASSAALVGTGTSFTTELSVGQVISVPGTAAEVRVVTAIADNTHLTVNSNFANTASGQTAARVNSALVFRTAGFYWVKAGLLGGSASWTAQIRLNGSTIIGEFIPSSATTSLQVDAAQSFTQWDYVEVVVTQSSGSPVNITADQRTFVATGVSGYVAAPYINIQDQKTSGTNGGTFTSGAWQTRTLQTTVSDAAGISSLASNQVTLPAGTYRVRVVAPASECGRHQMRVQNVTDAVTLALGATNYAAASTPTSNLAEASGRFTLTGSKAIEVQHRCEVTFATSGFGFASSWGTEVYAVAEFWKEA